MRKERLIVPLLVVLLLAWLSAQAVSSWLFEREMARTLADLEARGRSTSNGSRWSRAGGPLPDASTWRRCSVTCGNWS